MEENMLTIVDRTRPRTLENIKKERQTAHSVVCEKRSLLETAYAIRDRRLNVINDVTHKELPNTFRCVTRSGELIEVCPTIHAIDQFVWRYLIIDKCSELEWMNNNSAVYVMMNVFNKGKRISDDDHQYRNNNRKDSESAMVWGDSKMQFIVNTTNHLILTSELSGKYRPFNKPFYRGLVLSGQFNRTLAGLSA